MGLSWPGKSVEEEACLGCIERLAKSSNGFENRDGTVPARALLTFGELSGDGISTIHQMIEN